MINENKTSYVFTNEQNCKGCNKCILKCPTMANIAHWENSKNIIHIKSGYCISCGECISTCEHNARDYFDDLVLFFDDLAKKKKISVIIAPAANSNIEKLPQVIGFLKSKGVSKVYDVSYGADICTWAYIKHIKESKPKTIIAQPCPVVVSYIEKFRSELIEYLSPIQSPAICLAAYLKKYEKIDSSIAFISPCIGKSRECTDKNTHGVMNYNITFSKLIQYFKEYNINLDEYPAMSFDNIDTSIGFAFPRPGGLTENVRLHFDNNVWTKQVEGIYKIDDYFNQYLEDIEAEKPVPLIVDVLNCEHGCNLGTGTDKTANYNSIDYSINERKKKIEKSNSEELFKAFDKELKLEDFIRKYTDRTEIYKYDEKIDIESVYETLGKITESDRNLNCYSCGYGSCSEFVKAVARGDNHINNCHHFLLNKFISLGTIDLLSNTYNRNSYVQELSNLKEMHPKLVGIVFVDINKLKETNDLFGHNAGDKLITEASEILRKFYGKNIYRIGGDEFVILEKCNDAEEFEERFERLRDAIENSKDVHMSIGMAFSDNGEEIEHAIERAEKNMYADKAMYYKTHSRYERRQG